MMPITFTVPGQPVGKGRPRATTIGGNARMYTPAKTADYERMVALHASQAMLGEVPFTGPVQVQMDITFAIPPSWPKSRRIQALEQQLRHTAKPDIDNVTKAVLDASNGVLWIDDSQVVSLMARKRYGNTPGVTVTVARE